MVVWRRVMRRIWLVWWRECSRQPVNRWRGSVHGGDEDPALWSTGGGDEAPRERPATARWISKLSTGVKDSSFPAAQHPEPEDRADDGGDGGLGRASLRARVLLAGDGERHRRR
ncbi:hypothetical protein Dimus_016634 [Dionaea muscipula]